MKNLNLKCLNHKYKLTTLILTLILTLIALKEPLIWCGNNRGRSPTRSLPESEAKRSIKKARNANCTHGTGRARWHGLPVPCGTAVPHATARPCQNTGRPGCAVSSCAASGVRFFACLPVLRILWPSFWAYFEYTYKT